MPFGELIDSGVSFVACEIGVGFLTALKAMCMAEAGVLPQLANETLRLFYDLRAPGLRGVTNLILLGCPNLRPMPALQDELPARTHMIKDTRSATESAPLCAGDPSWNYLLKKSGGMSYPNFGRV